MSLGGSSYGYLHAAQAFAKTQGTLWHQQSHRCVGGRHLSSAFHALIRFLSSTTTFSISSMYTMDGARAFATCERRRQQATQMSTHRLARCVCVVVWGGVVDAL